MKKTVWIIGGLFLLTLAFAAPWLWLDNGEDIMESRFFRGQEEANFRKPKGTCECDGSCMNVKWVPFGAKVDACAEDYYFISFWGQRFYVDGE